MTLKRKGIVPPTVRAVPASAVVAWYISGLLWTAPPGRNDYPPLLLNVCAASAPPNRSTGRPIYPSTPHWSSRHNWDDDDDDDVYDVGNDFPWGEPPPSWDDESLSSSSSTSSLSSPGRRLQDDEDGTEQDQERDWDGDGDELRRILLALERADEDEEPGRPIQRRERPVRPQEEDGATSSGRNRSQLSNSGTDGSPKRGTKRSKNRRAGFDEMESGRRSDIRPSATASTDAHPTTGSQKRRSAQGVERTGTTIGQRGSMMAAPDSKSSPTSMDPLDRPKSATSPTKRSVPAVHSVTPRSTATAMAGQGLNSSSLWTERTTQRNHVNKVTTDSAKSSQKRSLLKQNTPGDTPVPAYYAPPNEDSSVIHSLPRADAVSSTDPSHKSSVRRPTATSQSATLGTKRKGGLTVPRSSIAATTTPWIRKFLAGRPKDLLLPIPRDYLADHFNLAQLPPIVERIGLEAVEGDAELGVGTGRSSSTPSSSSSSSSSSYPIYRSALRRILDDEETAGALGQPSPTVHDGGSESGDATAVSETATQRAAEALYLMVHARFVTSPRGLEAIRQVMMMDRTVFGRCPRPICQGTGLLPYGYSNDYTTVGALPQTNGRQHHHHQHHNEEMASSTSSSSSPSHSLCHRYCPSCGEVWISWESKTDGCAWGPSWCHLFLLSYGTQVYARELAAAAAVRTAASSVLDSTSSGPAPSSPRSFLFRRPLVRSLYDYLYAGSSSGNSGSSNNPTVDPASSTSTSTSTSPPPTVFGFRIHPATPFGRPWNEHSLSVVGGGGGGTVTNSGNPATSVSPRNPNS